MVLVQCGTLAFSMFGPPDAIVILALGRKSPLHFLTPTHFSGGTRIPLPSSFASSGFLRRQFCRLRTGHPITLSLILGCFYIKSMLVGCIRVRGSGAFSKLSKAKLASLGNIIVGFGLFPWDRAQRMNHHIKANNFLSSTQILWSLDFLLYQGDHNLYMQIRIWIGSFSTFYPHTLASFSAQNYHLPQGHTVRMQWAYSKPDFPKL
jgi:hypothetical protein